MPYTERHKIGVDIWHPESHLHYSLITIQPNPKNRIGAEGLGSQLLSKGQLERSGATALPAGNEQQGDF